MAEGLWRKDKDLCLFSGPNRYLYNHRYRRYNKINAGKENTFSLCL